MNFFSGSNGTGFAIKGSSFKDIAGKTYILQPAQKNVFRSGGRMAVVPHRPFGPAWYNRLRLVRRVASHKAILLCEAEGSSARRAEPPKGQHR
jgi:hypothetical protein